MATRYDGLAEWYDSEFATSELGKLARQVALQLLGPGPGKLLDVGCGTGVHTAAFAESGWSVTGVDVSTDQLRLARERGVPVVQADASALPFADGSFDAAVSLFTHTDIDDFGAVISEVARVVRPRGRLVYLGVHPCFVGHHAFVHDLEVPKLYPGYRDTSYRSDSPGIWREGLRARVGARHLPLGLFLQTFLDAGFSFERVEEPPWRDYPHVLALRARR